MTTDQKVQRARQALNNLRGVVRRKHTTGWVDRNARPQYEQALRWVVQVEDALGVEDPTTVKLDDRLTALKHEARAAGLLTYHEETLAERAVFGKDN